MNKPKTIYFIPDIETWVGAGHIHTEKRGAERALLRMKREAEDDDLDPIHDIDHPIAYRRIDT